MRLKIILAIAGIFLIISLALFGSSIREKALKGMIQDVSEYNCGKDGICKSCIIGGNVCKCSVNDCSCGNKTVDKRECEYYTIKPIY